MCENWNPTQPHTLGMFSRRLGADYSISCGDLCRCVEQAEMQCPECNPLITDHWRQRRN